MITGWPTLLRAANDSPRPGGSDLATIDEFAVVVPIGVMNGETAPLSGLPALALVAVVNLGVAKAGELTTTIAESSMSRTSTPFLGDFMMILSMRLETWLRGI
jgi:hypothetical protein